MRVALPPDYVVQSNHGKTFRLHYSFLSGEDLTIYKALFNAVESHDYNVCFDRRLDPNRIQRVFQMVLADNPTLFWVDKGLAAYSSDVRTEVVIRPIFDRDEVAEMKRQMTRAVESIRRRVEGESRSDFETALLVHDILTERITYRNQGCPEQQCMLGPLLKEWGVCEGIAFTYSYILYVCGVNCTTVYGRLKGERDGHAWNIVFLDGRGYHVDVTHDLACTSFKGNHRYFCLTDDEMTDRTWDSPVRCDSVEYNYLRRRRAVFNSVESMCRHIMKVLSDGGTVLEFRVVGVPWDSVQGRVYSYLGEICAEYECEYSGDGDYHHVGFRRVRLKGTSRAAGLLRRITT